MKLKKRKKRKRGELKDQGKCDGEKGDKKSQEENIKAKDEQTRMNGREEEDQ